MPLPLPPFPPLPPLSLRPRSRGAPHAVVAVAVLALAVTSCAVGGGGAVGRPPAPYLRPTRVTVDTIAADAGTVVVSIDSGRTQLRMVSPRGTFVIVEDSAVFARWADAAHDSSAGGDWIRTASRDPSPLRAPESIRVVPVISTAPPPDSARTTVARTAAVRAPVRYLLHASNGAWEGALELDDVRVMRLLQALHAAHAPPPPTADSLPPRDDRVRIERPVAAAAGNPPPHYPTLLREAGIEGEVLMEFIVDTTGHVVMPSVHLARYTRPEFALAVRAVLPSYRFVPAQMQGQRVPQIVQLPFQFSLAR